MKSRSRPKGKQVDKNVDTYPKDATLFPVFCAWCEGRKTIVGWSTVPNSHGVCRKHEKELNRQTEELRKAESK